MSTTSAPMAASTSPTTSAAGAIHGGHGRGPPPGAGVTRRPFSSPELGASRPAPGAPVADSCGSERSGSGDGLPTGYATQCQVAN
jgi:hypothetical protein